MKTSDKKVIMCYPREQTKFVGNVQLCNHSGKRCYSESTANIVLSQFKRHTGKTPKGSIPKRKYRCEFCGYWHLTSRTFYGAPKKFKYKKKRRTDDRNS